MKALAILLTLALATGSAFAATLVLQPDPAAGKDAMLNMNSPTTNYGTYQYLMVNYGTGRTVRGIVEFTGLSAITKGSTINKAELELWSRYNSPNDNYGIYRVNASWQEMTVNWSNQPAHFATAYAKVNVPGPGTYKWDVKKLVDEWVQGTYSNYGFILKRDNEAGGAWAYFVSSDYGTPANRPKLTVDYTPTAIAPTSIGKVKALFE